MKAQPYFSLPKYLKEQCITEIENNLKMLKDVLKAIEDSHIYDELNKRKQEVKHSLFQNKENTIDAVINYHLYIPYCENIKYRILLLWYEGSYQLWLQLVLGMIKEFIDAYNIKYKYPQDEKGIIKFFKTFYKPMDDYKSYDMLFELQHKVNVIKHARGSSYNIVKDRWPDFFEYGIDYLGRKETETKFHFANNGFSGRTFNVSIEDLERFTTAMIEFFDWIPEYIPA